MGWEKNSEGFNLWEMKENKACSNPFFSLYCIGIKQAQRVKLILCRH